MGLPVQWNSAEHMALREWVRDHNEKDADDEEERKKHSWIANDIRRECGRVIRSLIELDALYKVSNE